MAAQWNKANRIKEGQTETPYIKRMISLSASANEVFWLRSAIKIPNINGSIMKRHTLDEGFYILHELQQILPFLVCACTYQQKVLKSAFFGIFTFLNTDSRILIWHSNILSVWFLTVAWQPCYLKNPENRLNELRAEHQVYNH